MHVTMYGNMNPAPSPWQPPGSQFKSRGTQTEMRFCGDDFVMVSGPSAPTSRRPSNEHKDGSAFLRTMAWLNSWFD